MVYATPGGKSLASSAMVDLHGIRVASAFEPGRWKMTMAVAVLLSR